MNTFNLDFKIKTAKKEEIFLHLQLCDKFFMPPLSEKISLTEYAQKIAENSITFEAWHSEEVVGIIAVYFNDLINLKGYITNVSTLKDYAGNGIASILMRLCIKYAKENNFECLLLEVNTENFVAKTLYEKFGFTLESIQNCNLLMKYNIKNSNL